MKQVDVICISAINFDYMFHCKKSDIKRNKKEEPGHEYLNRKLSEVERRIEQLQYNHKMPSTQIGGSSYLALKTIHAIDSNISTALVGVVGDYDELDDKYDRKIDLDNEFDFIDNKDWLFHADENVQGESRYIGKSCVRLHHSQRDTIWISSCANSLLVDCIKNKEESAGNGSFVDFLAQAKWIHISSLGELEHFYKIMDYVGEAQKKNRLLKVSIDPGSEYTRKSQEEIQKYLLMADYVFLNEDEKNNLILSKDFPEHEENIKLNGYFAEKEDSKTKLLIVKRVNCHKLINFFNGIPYVHYHRKLPFLRICNDTGAGDCFAGGFIAGMLSDKLIAQQPAPIELGVLASKTRMETSDDRDIFYNIATAAKTFFLKKYKKGNNSTWQKINFYFKEYYKVVLAYLAGIVSSIIASIIYYLIFR